MNRNQLIRGKCEECGAPLRKSRTVGKFICEYCGSVYYSESFDESNWIEEHDSILGDPTANEPINETSSTKKASNRYIGKTILVVLVLSACGLIFLSSGLGAQRSNSSNARNKLDKPTMLVVLPAAEKAGKSVAFAGWEIRVEPEIDYINNKQSIQFTLQNWNDTKQTFRYLPSSIQIYDDLNNSYPLYIGNCAPDTPYINRQISFDPYQLVKFQSSTSWCDRKNSIPVFSGTIPVNAHHLYIHFDEFGVFQNITFVIDL